MADYTFREVQKQFDAWVQEVGKGYWNSCEMLARLVEVGEISRLFQQALDINKLG